MAQSGAFKADAGNQGFRTMTDDTVWLMGASGGGDSVEIRPARPGELAVLVAAFGQRAHLADRLSRQRDGQGVMLAAWCGGTPIGMVYLWTEPAEEPEIRDHLPDVPILNHLEVREEWRNRGVGTALVAAAERFLTERGSRAVALAIKEGDDAAERWYHHRHYRHWQGPRVACYVEPERAGRRTFEMEWCRVLVKSLDRP